MARPSACSRATGPRPIGVVPHHHRLAATLVQARDRGLERHRLREPQRVDQRVVLARVPPEPHAAQRGPERGGVHRDERAQPDLAVGDEHDLLVAHRRHECVMTALRNDGMIGPVRRARMALALRSTSSECSHATCSSAFIVGSRGSLGPSGPSAHGRLAHDAVGDAHRDRDQRARLAADAPDEPGDREPDAVPRRARQARAPGTRRSRTSCSIPLRTTRA